jgi:hypothetical protein
VETCTDLGYRTALGYCTANCTTLGKLGLLNSNQLSRIEYSDYSSTTPTVISTGNAPKHIVIPSCYMAETLDPKSDSNSSKGGKNSVSNTLSIMNLTPVTIMVVDTIGAVKSRRLLKILLDSGSTTTLINKRCLPKKCQPCQIFQSRMVNTLAGAYQSSAMVVMCNLRLPELDKNRNVEQQKALIFESKTCKYDVIVGADFLTKTGIDVKYSKGTIQLFKNELPLCDPHTLTDKDYVAIAEIIEIQQEVEFFGIDWYDPTCYAIEILNAKYEKVQIDEVVNQLEHLNTQQKDDIKQVLSDFTKLFDGTLVVYPLS